MATIPDRIMAGRGTHERRAWCVPFGKPSIENAGRDTANAIVYLASDKARVVAGTEIVVDDGMGAC